MHLRERNMRIDYVSFFGRTLSGMVLVSAAGGAELSRCNAFNDAATTWAAVASSGGGETLSLHPLVPSVLLPDGSEFKTWEQPDEHHRTFYVAQKHPDASDDNPGTEGHPWKTISRSAAMLGPGDRVIVKEGIYREWVRPARGGTGPKAMVSYVAAENQRVILSGSDVYQGPWAVSAHTGHTAVAGVWMAELPASLFHGYNPFGECNVTTNMLSNPYLATTQGWNSKTPYILRQGLVFQDGRRLVQVGDYESLAEAAGAYWVEQSGQRIHVRPFDNKNPREAVFEVTTRPFAFAPEKAGLGFIRLDGFFIERVASCFPMPQQGAISTKQGHHWIIQHNRVRQINALGLDYGRRQTFIPYDVPADTPKLGGVGHIIRHNAFIDCGICSMSGLGTIGMLIEDNYSSGCGWQACSGLWETGGIKLLYVKHSLIRRNVVQGTIDAAGLWVDHSAANTRITQNIITGAKTKSGGIFLEASYLPNLIDHNIVWDCQTQAFYQHDCGSLSVVHNLFGECGKRPVFMAPTYPTNRRMVDRETKRYSASEHNRVTGNVFYGLGIGGSDIPEGGGNVSDYNIFITPPDKKKFDLAAWQKNTGREIHSITFTSQMDFSPSDWILKQAPLLPRLDVPRMAPMTFDFFTDLRSTETVADAGPFLWANLKSETLLRPTLRLPSRREN